MNRTMHPLISMGVGLLLGALALVIAAIADAPWLALVGLGLVVFALIQRERLLGLSYWLLLGAALVAGFLVQRVSD